MNRTFLVTFKLALLIICYSCLNAGSSSEEKNLNGKYMSNGVHIDFKAPYIQIENQKDFDTNFQDDDLIKTVLWSKISKNLNAGNEVFFLNQNEASYVLAILKTKGRRFVINEPNFLEFKKSLNENSEDLVEEVESKYSWNTDPKYIKIKQRLASEENEDDMQVFHTTYILTNKVRTVGVSVHSFGNNTDLEKVVKEIRMY